MRTTAAYGDLLRMGRPIVTPPLTGNSRPAAPEG